MSWSEKIAAEFIKKINDKTDFIKEFPLLYPRTEIRVDLWES